jgi:hypothetical protein
MIDKIEFAKWVSVLEDRFRPLSEPVKALYYKNLSQKLTTEQFIAAAESLFCSEDFMPSVEKFVETAGVLIPEQSGAYNPYQLPASEPKPVHELPPDEQEEVKAAIARARKLFEPLTKFTQTESGFFKMGAVQVEEAPADLRLQDLARFESYKRTYEAYKSTSNFNHLAKRALDQIEGIAFDGHPEVAAIADKYLESIGYSAPVIDDAIATQIESQMEEAGL